VTRRTIVETRHGQMHVRATGGSGRALVALHMSPLSGSMWLPLMERLDRPVVAPDRLGFGCSDPPPGFLSMEEYAAATIDALDALDVVEFDLLGEHTGSVEAVAVAHAVGDRVGRIGLIAVPAYSESEREERLARRGSPAQPPVEDGSHLTELWNNRLSFRTPPYDLAVLHRNTVAELSSAGPHLAYRAVFAYPMAPRLSDLDKPVVVFAPHDDLITQTERARAALPAGSVYVDLPDLGLDLFDVAPDRMAGLVAQHLGAVR
jgi:pimeloyl-ACP methyl ester carboxylesterase